MSPDRSVAPRGTALPPEAARPVVLKVYVAGPYTKGDVVVNVRWAIRAGGALLDRGFVPFIPHLYHFWHFLEPREYADWTRLDLEWLQACDAVWRLPGESAGADAEVARAKELGIPVYYELDQLPLSEWESELARAMSGPPPQ